MEKITSELKQWVLPILIGFVLAKSLNYFVLDFVKIQGESMEPTFQNKDWVIVEKVTQKINGFDIGDIVIVDNGDRNFIKRVIGLPGDTIDIKNGKLVRNGNVIKEDYIKETMINNMDTEVTVSENSVYVMGDNRNNSSDSRFYGAYKLDKVRGKVLLEIKDNPLRWY